MAYMIANAPLPENHFHFPRRALALIMTALFLAGCMNATGMMLTDNTAVVSALGAASSDRDMVFESALAEAARLARAHGYQYFTIVKTDDKSITGVKYVPGDTIPSGNSARGNTRPLGLSNLGMQNNPGTSYTTPSMSARFVRPGFEITVRMYRPGEIDSRKEGVWNIDFLPGPPRREP
jgi:hypothetical protein